MLVSTAAMPIPESVVTCTRLVYEKMGAKLTPEGPNGSLIVGGLTKREVAYAWGVVRLAALLSASCCYCLQVLLNGRAVPVLHREKSCTYCQVDRVLQMIWILDGHSSMPLQTDDTCVKIMAEREAAVQNILQSKQFAFSHV